MNPQSTMSAMTTDPVHDQARALDSSDLELVERARRIAEEHSDGKVHTVGAAVRAADGSIHTGINLYHFTGGPCAELTALATARASGVRELTSIVAVGHEGRGVIAPCGRDRQVLLDYHPGIRVIVPTDNGDRSVSIEQLLPLGFEWTPAS